jgi:L,D-transpeptidase ErfK/SrfK
MGGACTHIPPVVESKEPVAVPAPPCQAIQTADCGPSGNCTGVEVFGATCSRAVLPDESLIEIARQYDLGWSEIEAANPGLDAFVPTVGATVTIPTAWILPRAGKPGTLVVNLSEMRLYQFPRSPGSPMTFPVGVGSEGWTTPLGAFSVIQKQVNPTWYPPASIRREEPDLPAMVPPGPDNPLGTHALRLSRGSILIHGTDKPFGVGRKASHGCLRLYPEDIPILYERVPVGTQVTIVREPVKVGVRAGRVYVEVHVDEDARIDNLAEAKRLLKKRQLLGSSDAQKLEAVVREARGFPVDVSIDPS